MARPRVLIFAESANPEWVSVPLVGWSHAEALGHLVDAHVVTHVRNRDALERAGWREGREFTSIDSELVAKPLWRFDETLRKLTGLGWTTTTALAALPYYYFEHLAWQRFGAEIRHYDLVHRLTPLSPTTPSVIAPRCRSSGVPFVWGPINGGVPWPPGFDDVRRSEGEWLSYVRNAYRILPGYRSSRDDATALVVGSMATWEELAPYHDRCVYLPENAIDPKRFSLRATMSLEGPLRVVFLGRLVPYKGADMLIEAAAPLVREGKVIVDILGDGPQMPELRALVEREGVSEGVRLVGWVAHTEVQARLAAAHLFGFPSIREFGGGVVLEAMAVGLVPVIVDYAGPAELVTERTGFRIPIGPRASIVEGLRNVLGRLTAERARLPEMSERARRRVMTLYTWEAKAKQMVQIYEWALGRASKPSFGMPMPDV
jgi:glycosyltransferase involved in cell wall biosynthesis